LDTKSNNGGQSSSAKLKWTMPARTPEEILSLGNQAAQALDSPIYSLAFQSQLQSIQDDWLQTRPEETKTREWLYAKTQAMGETAQELLAFVNAAKEVDAERLHKEELDQMSHAEESGTPYN